MRTWDRDPAVRQFERDAVVALVLMAGVALVVRRGSPDAALGVLGGGVLAAMGYWGVKSAVDAVTARPDGRGDLTGLRSGRVAWRAAKFVGRYALLAVAAYAVLAVLRAHPVGVLCGATAPALAAAAQLPRIWRRGGRLR